MMPLLFSILLMVILAWPATQQHGELLLMVLPCGTGRPMGRSRYQASERLHLCADRGKLGRSAVPCIDPGGPEDDRRQAAARPGRAAPVCRSLRRQETSGDRL